jgi:hypothetical protein
MLWNKRSTRPRGPGLSKGFPEELDLKDWELTTAKGRESAPAQREQHVQRPRETGSISLKNQRNSN